MFGCQQVLIKPDKELKAILEFICEESNKLHNCAVYYARQMYFKTKTYVRPFDIINELKGNPHYGSLCAQAAQQTCGAVGESVKSFKRLIELFWEDGLEFKAAPEAKAAHRRSGVARQIGRLCVHELPAREAE